MPKEESTYESGYSGPTSNDVCFLICAALENEKKRKLELSIDERCQRVILSHFEEAHKRVKRKVYTPVYEVMEQTTQNGFH